MRSLPRFVLLGVTAAILAFAAPAQGEPSGEVFFIEPADGAAVKSPFKIVFGAKNLTIVPAGTEHAHGGHHHLLIDIGLPPLDEPIPKDEHHRHFGGGQTEAEIELAPGKHRLQLLLGDHNHISRDPPIASKVITVTVEE
ncbi:MAG: DUF4399 domain-containing protein [Alphaproteobacteria bacterium]|nr:DUF4399 domain-containing protein [Alphaproteobacteria bacterium]